MATNVAKDVAKRGRHCSGCFQKGKPNRKLVTDERCRPLEIWHIPPHLEAPEKAPLGHPSAMPINHIEVTRISKDERTGVATGKVKATSSEAINGLPVAEVVMQVRVALIEGESRRKLKDRLYDEALMFLELFD